MSDGEALIRSPRRAEAQFYLRRPHEHGNFLDNHSKENNSTGCWHDSLVYATQAASKPISKVGTDAFIHNGLPNRSETMGFKVILPAVLRDQAAVKKAAKGRHFRTRDFL